MEIWKDVVGFEGLYQVSNEGNVRSVDRHISYKDSMGRVVENKFQKGVEIAKRDHEFGYDIVTLSKDGKPHTRTVHKLVAMAFLGKREDDGLLVRHLDGNCKNNRESNLAVGTQVDNMQDALGHGTVEQGERRYNAKVTTEIVLEIREKKRLGARNIELANEYGLSEIHVHKIVTGLKWKSVGGYIEEPRKSKKLNEKEREKVVEDRKAGMVYSELQAKYGISRTQIANILKGADVA